MRTIAMLRRVASGLCTAAVGMFAAAPAGAVSHAPIAHQRGLIPTDIPAGTYAVTTQSCNATLNLGSDGTIQGTLADGSTMNGTFATAGASGPARYRFDVTQVHKNGDGKITGYTHSKGTFTHDPATHHLEGQASHEHQDANKVTLKTEQGSFKGDRK
jgi:hypothetical protein